MTEAMLCRQREHGRSDLLDGSRRLQRPSVVWTGDRLSSQGFERLSPTSSISQRSFIHNISHRTLFSQPQHCHRNISATLAPHIRSCSHIHTRFTYFGSATPQQREPRMCLNIDRSPLHTTHFTVSLSCISRITHVTGHCCVTVNSPERLVSMSESTCEDKFTGRCIQRRSPPVSSDSYKASQPRGARLIRARGQPPFAHRSLCHGWQDSSPERRERSLAQK